MNNNCLSRAAILTILQLTQPACIDIASPSRLRPSSRSLPSTLLLLFNHFHPSPEYLPWPIPSPETSASSLTFSLVYRPFAAQ